MAIATTRRDTKRRQLPATTADRQRAMALASELDRTAFDTSPVKHPLQGISRLGAAAASTLIDMRSAQAEKEAIAAKAAAEQAQRDKLAQILRGFAPDQADPPMPTGLGTTGPIAPDLQGGSSILGGAVDLGDDAPLPEPIDSDPNAFLLGGAARRPPSAIGADPAAAITDLQRPALGAQLAAGDAAARTAGGGPGAPGAGGGGLDAGARRRALAAQLAGIPGMEGAAVQLAIKDDPSRFDTVPDATSLGLPKGTVAQIDRKTGQIHIVTKPDRTEDKAPTIGEFFDKDGNPYKATWNADTKTWDRQGGSRRDKGPAEDRVLVEIADPESPTGTRLVERKDAIGKPGKPGSQGMTIYDSNGKVVAQIGGKGDKSGGSGLTPASKTEIEKALLNSTGRMQAVTEIQNTFDPSFLQLQTQGRNAWRKVKDKVGVATPEDQAEIARYTKFAQSTASNLNSMIKAAAGTAVSGSEEQRLYKEAPTDQDGPTEFKTKLDNVTRQLILAHARMTYEYRNGVDPRQTTLSLQDMQGKVQKRGEEIDRELRASIPDQAKRNRAVRDQLKSDFGI